MSRKVSQCKGEQKQEWWQNVEQKDGYSSRMGQQKYCNKGGACKKRMPRGFKWCTCLLPLLLLLRYHLPTTTTTTSSPPPPPTRRPPPPPPLPRLQQPWNTPSISSSCTLTIKIIATISTSSSTYPITKIMLIAMAASPKPYSSSLSEAAAIMNTASATRTRRLPPWTPAS